MPTRRRAFRSANEEYAKILDIVGRYAIHCSGVAFSCKKHGDSGVSISTSAQSSTIDRIRQIYGSAVANELIDFNVEDRKRYGFRASGFVTNANYHVKRTTILLFINHRAVESSALRKAIEQTYAAFLPKGGHPFVYIDLEIEPHRVDVNVHPTKREVNFLHEDEIIEEICSAIRAQLAQVDSSRTFMTQTLLPGATPAGVDRELDSDARRPGPTSSSTRPYEHNLVRTDSRMRKITSMLPAAPPPSSSTPHPQKPTTDSTPHDRDKPADDDGTHYETTDREPVRIALTSVKNLRAQVRAAMHNDLTEMLATHTYVGLVDERRRIAAVQSGVKLYLVDYGLLGHEFFYQIGLTDFGNFGVLKLDPPPKLLDLLQLAVENERNNQSLNNEEEEQEEEEEDVYATAPTRIAQTLLDRRDMLDEYFSLSISPDGNLLTIPLLLKGYVPSLAKLPRFLLRLGPYVDWTAEEPCFRTFLRELAAFYTPEELPPPKLKRNDGEREEEEEEGEEEDPLEERRAQLARMLEHVLFPAIRARMVATKSMLSGVVEVADLKGLYRVFERC